MSPLSAEAAFLEPDNFFLSSTTTSTLPLTIYNEEPDLLVPLDQARVPLEKLHWLRVDLYKIREFSFDINSRFIFLLFSLDHNLSATMGIKFTSTKHARQLIAWATNSTISRTIKFNDTASPEQHRRKFERCLNKVIQRKDKSAGAAAAVADYFKPPPPVAKKSYLLTTDEVPVFRRTRSSCRVDENTDTIKLDDLGAFKKHEASSRLTAATESTSGHTIELRGSVSRTSTAKRPLPREMELERWSVKNPNWAQDWRLPLTYSRTTVDKDDVARLDEGEFLNDNIINFYIQFLQDTLKKSDSSIAKSVYFHNTFFYEKLRPRKGREIIFDGVKRWTAKVELFSYDYIVVPVNENAHWWLAIICNVPKILAATLPEETPGSHLTAKNCDQRVTLKQCTAAADLVDMSCHQPRTNDVANVDKSRSGNDVTSVSAASRATSATSLCFNDHQRDVSHVVEHAAGEGDESVVTNTEETESVRAKSDADIPGAIHVDEDHRTGSNIRDTSKAVTSKRDSIKDISNNSNGNKDDEVMEVTSDSIKQDATDPRILTLDSLGNVHAASVSHLKQWLMAEIVERTGIAPKDPGRLGMTAKNIPQQENFCDCGVYLLLYIQEFVKDPDSFIEDVVLRREHVWYTSAPDMRNQLRDLILHMQKENQITEEAKRRSKKKSMATTAKAVVSALPAKPPSPLLSPATKSEAAKAISSPFMHPSTPQADFAENSACERMINIETESRKIHIEKGHHKVYESHNHNDTLRSPISHREASPNLSISNISALPDQLDQRP
ncbi:hypothetical protein SEPCBS119000_005870 [Sporothrix epigloea]|uniref:Ubiquitin-like protease family profile domain-containing protein n=1 Tax=Sporothrix epigloea TaxID=1892477 RepID=A0ABP0E1S7_9PEZI